MKTRDRIAAVVVLFSSVRAGEPPALQEALAKVPAAQREGMEFLIANMPDRDRKELTAELLLENVAYAYRVMAEVPWGKRIPKDIFLNNVLPYANVNERRDRWRPDFYEKFLPLVKDCATSSAAAARLNVNVFPTLKVRYSRRRLKADQSPYESIETGTASCTGLSILLIDACRAVGVPARFVGTPLWSDRSGNHSWVEIWDDGWHFTGAAEPTGDALDRGWFVGRASGAKRDDPLHAIYAVSFKRTPLRFPLVWNRGISYVRAVNVTDRYAHKAVPLEPGLKRLAICVLERFGGDRVAASVAIRDGVTGALLFEGTSKDERFDGNDHLIVPLREDGKVRITLRHGNRVLEETIGVKTSRDLETFFMSEGTETPSR